MKQKLLSIFFLCTCLLSLSFAQSRQIRGKVTAASDASPLSGVSVATPTGQATQTDGNGNYVINLSGSDVLIFSYIGYTPQRITLGNSGVVNVQLVSEESTLDEVLITGYGTTTKALSTGAAATVSGAAIENIPMPSVDKMLQGRVAGLQSVAGSGQPGSAQQIRIRGVGSFSASAEPLYVVDGVPINSGDISRMTTTANTLAGINANDIENISVLKDASAASVYGSRAANGVIVITTKSGKAGKTLIRADFESGVATAGYLNDRNRPLTTDEYRELTAEGIVNRYPTSYDYESALAYVDENMIGEENAGVNTNWLDQVTRTGRTNQVNLSANGGTENTQFNLSGGYFGQEGTVINSEFKRYTTALNLKNKATDRLTIGLGLNGAYTNQNGPTNAGYFSNPVLAAYFVPSYVSPYNADGSPATENFSSGVYNPVAIATMDQRNNNTVKLLGNVNGEYKILDNLKVTTKYGIDYNGLEEDMYYNPDYGDYMAENGGSYRYYTRYFNWVWTNLLHYNWDIVGDNNWLLNVQAGYESQKSQQYTSSVGVTGLLPISSGLTVPSTGAVMDVANGSNSDYTFTSWLAIGDISYKNKYVLSGSFRRDGSSRFGSENRYGNFWSIGGSWNVDREDFVQDISWLSQLKLRGSYGVNGNAGIGNYDWLPQYGYGYDYNGSNGSILTTVGNINLTWEENRPLDFGIDAGFFNNRLSLTVDWYKRTSTNLLQNSYVPTSVGFNSYTANIGSMENKGIEISVSGTPVQTEDFRWDLGFNFSANKNTVTRLNNGEDVIDGRFIRREGNSYYSFYGREWAGVDPENGDALWYVNADETNNGETTNNYNSAGRVILGQADPKGFGSITTSFTYKGLSLSAMLYYSYGNMVQDSWASYTQGDGYAPTYNKVASQLDRWQNPGDITDVPKYVYGNTSSSSSFSSRFLYKGDYMRLRDVTLGYQFPQKFIQPLKLSNLNLYVRGTNLLTFVKDKDMPYDPETYVTGATNFDVYLPKTFTVGLKVGF